MMLPPLTRHWNELAKSWMNSEILCPLQSHKYLRSSQASRRRLSQARPQQKSLRIKSSKTSLSARLLKGHRRLLSGIAIRTSRSS